VKFIFAFAGSFISGAIAAWAVPWFLAAAATNVGLYYWVAEAFQACLPWLFITALGLGGFAAVRWVFQERDASATANAAADARALVAQAEREAQRIEQELIQEEEAVKARAREIMIRAEQESQRIRAEAEQIRADLQEREAQIEEKRKIYRADLERAEQALREKNILIPRLVNALDAKKKAIYDRHHDNPGRIKRSTKRLDAALTEAANQGFEPDHG